MILRLDEHLMAARGMIEAGATPEFAYAERSGAMRELRNLIGFQKQQHWDIAPYEEGLELSRRRSARIASASWSF